jgi:hypothetical protein
MPTPYAMAALSSISKALEAAFLVIPNVMEIGVDAW